MTPKDTHKDKDPLAQSLLASAQDLSPSYSERLHQRTMRAIRAQETRAAVYSHPIWNRTIAAIAATGVERISVGALTHSATNLDLGLDWIL